MCSLIGLVAIIASVTVASPEVRQWAAEHEAQQRAAARADAKKRKDDEATARKVVADRYCDELDGRRGRWCRECSNGLYPRNYRDCFQHCRETYYEPSLNDGWNSSAAGGGWEINRCKARCQVEFKALVRDCREGAERRAQKTPVRK